MYQGSQPCSPGFTTPLTRAPNPALPGSPTLGFTTLHPSNG